MKPSFFYILFLFSAGLSPLAAFSQEPQSIKFKRESNLVKVVFDVTESKLFVIDRFGNPRENKIASYKLYVKAKRETKEFNGYGNTLNPEMIKYLNKQNNATKIFFTEISVEEDDGHLTKLPDVIDTWFPDCTNCERKKR